MNLLVDTHLLLWAASDPQQMSEAARVVLNDGQNDLHFSVASLWEVVIKNGLGREDFSVDAALFRRGLKDNGYLELTVTGQHVLAVANLPPLHRDPFDRVLIAQARTEGFMLLTEDQKLCVYGQSVRVM